MFTGIVIGMGRVVGLRRSGEAAQLELDMGALAEQVGLGDSVAVDGTCLTASARDGGRVCFDVIRETLQKTTLGSLQPGNRVNLELALRYGDRMGGHFVTGHVDGVGVIAAKVTDSGQTTLSVHVSERLAAGMIAKGSIAIDGISLTLIDVERELFRVGLIPETLERTTLGHKGQGEPVNLETDHLGKWVQKLVSGYLPQKSSISELQLKNWGYGGA